MVHWQFFILCTLFITTICASWPGEEDNSKICLHFTGSYDGDLKCSIYCKSKGKAGGRCNKKRCVCYNNEEDDDKDGKHKGSQQANQQSSFFVKSRSNDICKMGSTMCRLNCNNMGNLDGSCINGVCVCLRL
ncbi:unnamed protein product [Rotaria sp. Silwood1]|nr:unnamed protein product [Rotaria sp. Silwood1]